MIVLSEAAVLASVDAVTALLQGGGALRIYSGAKPAFPDDPITTQTLLLEIPLPPLFYQDATITPDKLAGLAVGQPLAPVNPVAGGNASFGRVVGTADAPVFDGDVGIIGSEAMFRLSALTLSPSVPVSIVLSQYAQPRG